MARSEPGKQYRREKRKKEIQRLRQRSAKKTRIRLNREGSKDS